jgi:hypothetical protein
MLLTAPVVKAQMVEPVVIEQELKIQLIDLIKQLISLLQAQIQAINQQTSVVQKVIDNPITLPEVKPAGIVIGEYSNFVYDISVNPLPFDKQTIAIGTIKVFDVNGNGMPNTKVTISQRRCKCNDQPIQTEYGYFLEGKTNEKGELSFNIKAYNKLNNFLTIQVLNNPVKWIPIPTLFEDQIWNWNDNDGGYFIPK